MIFLIKSKSGFHMKRLPGRYLGGFNFFIVNYELN